jgi:hypothetical protein
MDPMAEANFHRIGISKTNENSYKETMPVAESIITE